MKLDQEITLYPPPVFDDKGNIVYKDPIILKELYLVFVDDPQEHTINVEFARIEKPLTIYSAQEYINLGNYTKQNLYDKLFSILSDNPQTILQTLFEPTLAQHPTGPGTILSKIIKSLGINMVEGCSCKQHAITMNQKGIDWCEQNKNIILEWLREEAQKRKLPFLDSIGEFMIQRAINKSKKLSGLYNTIV